jgi:hypothetical protein
LAKENMWLSTINIITLYNLNEIKIYKENKFNYLDIESDICAFVVEGINNLPVFYSLPLKIYLVVLRIFFLRTRNVANLYKIKIPFLYVLTKLIKSLILLRLFDELSISDTKINLNLIQE